MADLYPDTFPAPGEISADAILVCRWVDGPPARWETVGIVVGAATIGDALTAAGETRPERDTNDVLLATKIGGRASRSVRVNRVVTTTVDVTLTDEGASGR